MKTKLPIILSLALAINAYAGSATWNLNPTSSDWNTAANWTPATVPNAPGDVATFAVSNTTALSLSMTNEVNSFVFNSGASLFTFTVGTTGFADLKISGAGITNNSGVTQTFITQRDRLGASGNIHFTGSATAGSGTVFINQGGVDDTGFVGNTFFADNTSAANGTYFCNGGTKGGFGGDVVLFGNATAGNGTFIVDGAASARSSGGLVQFSDAASAGDATFNINGTDAVNGSGAQLNFFASATAGNATLIANGGSVAGGVIGFRDLNTSGGTSRIEVFGNGTLDVTTATDPTVTIGSLEGDGLVLLGHSLAIGSNSLSTTFSGVAQGVGSITKIGTGTLTMSGANTYTGSTNVTDGVLLAANTTGSATGTGVVNVVAGTLGGNGIISGAVTVGTGSGAGASLAPAFGTNKQVSLTLQNSLTLQADATYTYTFKARTNQARADLVVANGVTINGATIKLKGKTQGTVTAGTVLTVISNTSASPISDTFSNLADGAVVNVNGNNLQASYSGGDGNDLTLTAVP